jgi:hypothetical protein
MNSSTPLVGPEAGGSSALKPDPHEHCVTCGHERITHIPACDDLSGDDPCTCQQFGRAGGSSPAQPSADPEKHTANRRKGGASEPT